MFDQRMAREASETDQMPVAPESESEQSRTTFTSKGTLPPPLAGEVANQNAVKAASASDMAFGAPADPAWLKQTGDSLVAARKRVRTQQMGLLLDDQCSTFLLGLARTVMTTYETNWKQAKINFEGRVGRHLEAAAARRETGNFLMGVAIGGLAPHYKAFKFIEELMERKDLLEGSLAAVSLGAPAPKTASGPAEAKAPDRAEVQWMPLVDQLFRSKSMFNASMTGVTAIEHEYDDLIEAFRGGSVMPGSAEATRAEKLAQFSLPEQVSTTRTANEFLRDMQIALGDKGVTEIERQMAIDWIAALQPDQIDALDDLQPYLAQIGVIGPRSKGGLNIDAGTTLYDDEEQKIWTKARVHNEMQGLAGEHGAWLGGRVDGDKIHGTVRVNGIHYAAVAKAPPSDKCVEGGMSAAAGGTVSIRNVQHATAMPELAEGIPFSSIHEERYAEQLRMGQFELVVEADAKPYDLTADQVRPAAE